jgi:lysine N6-hydroxylase
MRPRAIVAIGAGPSNLSLAALAAPYPDLATTVLERRPVLAWHPGMMLDGALMQTSPLKDLVTLIDPTSTYTFLSFLKDSRRLYRAIVRGLDRVTRVEFEAYLRWAAKRLGCVGFGKEVIAIDTAGDAIRISASDQQLDADAVVIGVGRSPAIPEFARNLLGDRVFHSSSFLAKGRDFAGQRVVVVGGGQSGAEVVREILRGPTQVQSLHWLSRRANIFALEDSPFVNEWFFPQYGQWFHKRSAEVRMRTLKDQQLASDGVSPSTLSEIYDLLYACEVETPGDSRCEIRVGTAVDAMDATANGIRLVLRDCVGGFTDVIGADIVILCTGYSAPLPAFLEPLRGRLSFVEGLRGESEPELREDFSIVADGPLQGRLYLQNGGMAQHGIADPNLSLISWRSARILNSILGTERFDCGGTNGALSWPSGFEASDISPMVSRKARRS